MQEEVFSLKTPEAATWLDFALDQLMEIAMHVRLTDEDDVPVDKRTLRSAKRVLLSLHHHVPKAPAPQLFADPVQGNITILFSDRNHRVEIFCATINRASSVSVPGPETQEITALPALHDSLEKLAS